MTSKTIDSIDMLGKMILIREFDELAIKLRTQGKIYGAVHPYVGQEAVAVGVCANLTNADLWLNLSWKDAPSYNVGAAKYVHDNLKPGLHVKFENSNEVWNYQFQQAQDSLAEATALKIHSNNGYGACGRPSSGQCFRYASVCPSPSRSKRSACP